MISVYKSGTRGLTKIDWLTSYHSFSFGEYYNPSRIHFGPLRVINDDYLEPGGGFPTHPHKNMEIITIVLEGELSHTDSTGNSETIKYGEVQKMSAGTGIFHSEFNASDSEKLHLLQIWILPETTELTPSYEKVFFNENDITGKLFKVAAYKNAPVKIHQDVSLSIALFKKGENLNYTVSPRRKIYIHIIEGKVKIEDEFLEAGDAVEIEDRAGISLSFMENSRFILFDMAGLG